MRESARKAILRYRVLATAHEQVSAINEAVERVLQAINDAPDDATIDDVLRAVHQRIRSDAQQQIVDALIGRATIRPQDTLRDAGIDDARQATYQRKMSMMLGGGAASAPTI